MRFVILFVILIIGVGFFLQEGVHFPYLSWVGHLPGDLLVRKNNIMIYFPLTSAFIFSTVLSLIGKLLSR